MTTIWTLPVPSTALLGDGPIFEKRPGRVVALRFSYESGDDPGCCTIDLGFEGVEAFRATYYRARDESMLKAYDRLIDLGASVWLHELTANLLQNGGDAGGLVHYMIDFDDGPCYEVICRSYRVEETRGDLPGDPDRG